MAENKNLGINERLNVEQPNLRESLRIENENCEDNALKFIYIKG